MAIVAFIKTHLISLACGLATLVFVIIGVLGMVNRSVVTQMEKRANVRGQLTTLRAQAKNEAVIEAEAEKGRRFQDQFARTQEVARQINAREPLLPGVFPRLSGGGLAIAYNFREAYRKAFDQLARGKLHGGDLPDEQAIADAAEEIREIAARKREEQEESGKTLAGGPRPGPAGGGGPRPPQPPPPPRGGSEMVVMGDMPPMIATDRPGGPRGGQVPVGYGGPPVAPGDPETDPRARANVLAARRARCYVSTDPQRHSFHVSPIADPDKEPQLEEMWYAQVGLWIQQDVVNAIAEMNEAAARKLPEDRANVENLPVKRLQGVRVLGYVTPKGTIPFEMDPTTRGIQAAGEVKPTFTGRSGTDQYDVVRFTVVVVVEQRELLRFIDALVRQNFYLLVEMRQQVIGPDAPDYQDGYLYGAAPVVRAELQFEGYLARNVYEKMFPVEVRRRLGLLVEGGPRP